MSRANVVLITAVLLLVLAAPAAAGPSFATSVPLPDGFYPEGIAIGSGHDFYAGSLLDGAIYQGDLRTGEGEVLASGSEGRAVVGLSFDDRSGLLWGVGSDAGAGRVFAFDGRTGELTAEVDVPGGFLNDVVVTREAAYVTDSFADVLWKLPLDGRGRPAGPAQAIPLGGDFELVSGDEPAFNLNGIDATADGDALLAVHSSLGVLYRIDPATGTAAEVDLGGADLASGDGIMLHGRTLYVVQNFLNQVAVVELSPDLATGELADVLTSDAFRVPTTAARFGERLYLVNARFDVAPPPALGGEPTSVEYDIVSVPR